jgi:hypothetical protein
MATDNYNMNDPLAFVRSLWGGMGVSMPGMVTPTFDVDELDKRIKDMKAVEGWLRMNLSMLQMTIQGLEMQRTTLGAVDAMRQMATDAVHSVGNAAASAESASRAQAANAEPTPRAQPAAGEDAVKEQPAAGADATSALSQAAMWPWQMMQQMREQMQQSAAAASEPAPAPAPPPAAKPRTRRTPAPK